MTGLTNLFDGIPADLPQELFQTLLATPGFRIERIVSLGHASPEGFWYDQEAHEWVLLLAGAARLTLEGTGRSTCGRARSSTSPPAGGIGSMDRPDPTIWLAIHHGRGSAQGARPHEAIPGEDHPSTPVEARRRRCNTAISHRRPIAASPKAGTSLTIR